MKCEKHINHYLLPGVPEKTLTGGSCPVSTPTDQERPAGASWLPVEAGSEELQGVVWQSQRASGTSEELDGREEWTSSLVSEEYFGETSSYEQSGLSLGQTRLEEEEVKEFDHDGDLCYWALTTQRHLLYSFCWAISLKLNLKPSENTM